MEIHPQIKRKWAKTPAGKASQKKRNAKWAKTPAGKASKRKTSAKWSKTPAGKILKKRQKAKRRGKEHVPLCSMPKTGNWDWHHVDKEHVVPVLKKIHRAIAHVCGDGKLEGILG